jgi:hypothetical protein
MPSIGHHIWRLEIGGVKYLGLIPHDLAYFGRYFKGRPMAPNWAPPPIELSGRSKKLPDFVSWMKSAPVVSEKARSTLEPILRGCVQFFDFHEIKAKRYFAMNVICVERALLDLPRSKILYADDQRKLAIAVKEAVFVDPLPPKLPPMFKLAIAKQDALGDIYVTQEFAAAAVRYKLTGLELSDPSQDSFKRHVNGHPLNVVPGIIT